MKAVSPLYIKRELKSVLSDLKLAQGLIERELNDVKKNNFSWNAVWIAEGDLLDATNKIRKLFKKAKVNQNGQES